MYINICIYLCLYIYLRKSCDPSIMKPIYKKKPLKEFPGVIFPGGKAVEKKRRSKTDTWQLWDLRASKEI